MATVLAWLRRALDSLARHDGPEHQWVEPGNAVTRSILAGTLIEIPETEPSPLAPVTAQALDLSAFDEKPIPPLGVEPPLVRPMVAPAWEPVATATTAAETPKPRVAEQDDGEPAAEKAGGDRKKRRWWRAA